MCRAVLHYWLVGLFSLRIKGTLLQCNRSCVVDVVEVAVFSGLCGVAQLQNLQDRFRKQGLYVSCPMQGGAQLVCAAMICATCRRQVTYWNLWDSIALQIEKLSNQLLDSCDHYRESMGEITDSVSLATALETLWSERIEHSASGEHCRGLLSHADT